MGTKENLTVCLPVVRNIVDLYVEDNAHMRITEKRAVNWAVSAV